MKHFLSNILVRIIPALAALAITAGCDSVIYDDEGDCNPVHIVRFEYDWNMKFVDAFPSEVPSVDLYIFNDDGKLVDVISREVTRDQAKDFKIELRGYDKGKYKFLAWCGVRDSEHFIVNPDEVEAPQLEHHICRINSLDEEGDSNGHIRKDIMRLYHGTLDNVDMTADEGYHEHVVKLMKNTNVVRVVLQHLSGAPMNKDDYDIKITASNGLYAHDNAILPHRELTYHPWLIRSGEASFHPEDQPQQEDSRAQTSVSAVIAELTVGRLMREHIKDAMLTVHTRDGQLIFSIPLIEYLLLVKGYYYGEDGHTPMSDQEYLDRQDEYPMTFFLDERDKWISTVIYINSWRIVRDTPTIH